MIAVQEDDERKFHVHESLLQPFGLVDKQRGTHPQRDNCRRPRNAVPKAACHELKLLYEYRSLRLRFAVRLRDVDQQSRKIEQTREPGNDKDDVNRLEIKERHTAKVCSGESKNNPFKVYFP